MRTLETMPVVEGENPFLFLRKNDKAMEQHQHTQGVTSADDISMNFVKIPYLLLTLKRNRCSPELAARVSRLSM